MLTHEQQNRKDGIIIKIIIEMQTYLVEGYDETAISVFKYLAMFLSVIGFFKTNFVTTTYFSAPN